jgi:hypothetical protein
LKGVREGAIPDAGRADIRAGCNAGAAIVMPRADSEAMRHHSGSNPGQALGEIARPVRPRGTLRSSSIRRPGIPPESRVFPTISRPCHRRPKSPELNPGRAPGNSSTGTNGRTASSAAAKRSSPQPAMPGTASSPIPPASPQSEPESGQPQFDLYAAPRGHRARQWQCSL